MVEDIGIEAAMLPRVFETFAQADRSLDRSKGGLGLGLALAKGLVELHGGRMRAASEGPGRGAVFTLPLVSTFTGPSRLRPMPCNGSSPIYRDRSDRSLQQLPGTGGKGTLVSVLMLQDGEDQIVAERLRLVLAAAAKG